MMANMDFFSAAMKGTDLSWTWEKKKQHIENNMAELTVGDGVKLGKITSEGFKALQNNSIDGYTPFNEMEKKTIEAYKSYVAKETVRSVAPYDIRPALPQVKSAVGDVKRFVQNTDIKKNDNALKSGSVPVKDKSGNLTTTTRDMSKDTLASGSEFAENKRNNDIAKFFDAFENTPKKVGKSLAYLGENVLLHLDNATKGTANIIDTGFNFLHRAELNFFNDLAKEQMKLKGKVSERVTKAIEENEYHIDLNNERIKNSVSDNQEELNKLNSKYKDVPENVRNAFNFVGEAAEMTPNVLLSVANPAMGTAYIAASAYSNSYGEALNDGATTQEASNYALASAALEVALEKLGGNKLFGGKTLTDSLTDKFVKRVAKNKLAQKTIRFIAESSEEGIEEVLSTALQPLIKKFAYSGTYDAPDFDEYVNSFFGGMIGSAVWSGAAAATNKISDLSRKPTTEVHIPAKQNIDIKTPPSTEIAKNGTVKTTDVNSAIERIVNGTATNKDIDLFKPANAQNRAMFEEATGVKLPSTNSEVRHYLRDYASGKIQHQTVNPEYEHIYDVDKVERDFVDNVNEEIESAIKNIRSGKIEDVKDAIEVTELSNETTNELSHIVGFDVSGYSCKIERDALLHTEDRHGINGRHDQSLADPQDTARMGYVINNHDSINWVTDEDGNAIVSKKYNDRNNKPSPVLMMAKKIDGTYCVSHVVPDSKKRTLWITSVRIQKADVGSQVPNGNTPQLTPEAPLVSSSANNNIPQDKDTVNNQYMQNDLNNSNKNDIINTNGGMNDVRTDSNSSRQEWGTIEGTGEQSSSVSGWRELGNRRINELVGIHNENRPEVTEVRGKRGEKVTYYPATKNEQKSDAEIFLDNEAKKYGVEVEYATDLTVTSKTGKVSKPVAFIKGNKVVLSDKATFKDAVHEFVHCIRNSNPQKYNSIKSYIAENMQTEIYDLTFNYYVEKYSEIYDFDFDSMNESQRKRAMDVIEEEFVCDMIAYNKTGSNTSMINEAEFTTLVEEYFDTNKSEISYTSQNNQKPVTTPNLTPIRFINGLDFIPLPRTKNGNVKRNISHEASLKLNDIVSNYNKNGKVDKSKVNELFDMLYNSAVVENVENFDEALDFIKNERLYISPTDKQSITDFNKFRQSMMMKLKITTDKSKGGLSVDIAFQEFVEMFPGMVDKTLTHPADQLQALADFVTNAKDRQKATLDEYFGSNAQNVKEQMQEMFNDELDAFLDGEEIKYAVASSEKEGAFVMSEDEIKNIQAIGRKSINDFSTEEINKTQTLAKKLYNEMGVKSPFFRAWFGDWRANDKTTLEVVEIYETKQKNPRGQFVNRDTGFSINSSSVGYDETNSHSGKDKLSVIAMQNIDKIIENAILLDTEVSEYGRGKKSVYTCFMHKFYTPVYIEGKPCIAKMSVDESYQPGAKDTNKKFYHVRAIKIEPVSSVGIGFNHTPIMDKSGSTIIVADLFNIVKKYDSEFNPKECSLVLNEDGTPMIVYHGTDAKFYVFDMSKGRANMDIQGSFFSPWELDSQGYGKNVGAYYLNIKNPADGPTAYAALNKFKGQNNAGVKAKDYLIKQGYDGVNFYDEEYVAFYPTQIKSATDNIGTFDSNNPDVRYSTGTTEKTAEYYNQRYAELLEQYGAVQKGMQPRIDVKVPKKSSKNQYVSNFARTFAESGIMPSEMQGDFEKMVVDGTMSHEVFTNKKAENGANQRINRDDFKESVKEFEILVNAGRVNKEDIAMGQMLLNIACQNKDVELAKKLAVDLSVAATQFGQNVQAFSMLKRMSPDGQLYYLEKSVEKINREIRDKYKDIAPIEIDNKLAENLLNAKTKEEVNEAVYAIEKNIGEQIPATKMDKWNAWRYLAMLGNTRTHFRNVFGNAVFAPARGIKNVIGAGFEKALPKAERTKSLTKTKESKDFAENDWSLMADVAKGNEGKYGTRRGIEEHRKIFKTKWLEAARKFNTNALEIEDGWFLESAYKSAFAQAMTARGLTAEYLSSGTKQADEDLQKIREYAINEAQKATFRDANEFSDFVSRLRFNGDGKLKKGANMLIEGVLPFKKTPANILVRGVEYSPVGLMKGISDLYQVKKGNMSAAKAIDDISSGLTGTAIVGLGAFLAHLGALVVAPDEDDEVAGYKKMLGAQNYALKIGDNTYTIDWMAPIALPLFVGAEITNTIKNTEQPSLTAIFDALTRISEPVLELSCLSGIQSALESIQYSNGNIVGDLVIDMISSYVTQALPTIGGQVARTIDNTQRNIYYKDKTSGVPQVIQGIINKAMSKVPGLTYFLPEKVDRWGRVQKYGSLPERVLENFVSPGYYSNDKSTFTDKKLTDLYEKTGDKSVLPDVAAKSFKVDGDMKYMSADEYVEYSKERGSLSYEYITSFLNELGTNTLDYSLKVEVVNGLYKYANAKAKEKVSDYVLDKQYVKVDEAIKAGISPDKYFVAYYCSKGKESDKTASGKTIPNSATRKEFKEIKKNVTGLSEAQKIKLLKIMGYSDNQIKMFKYDLPN